jgi:hypothetical protein
VVWPWAFSLPAMARREIPLLCSIAYFQANRVWPVLTRSFGCVIDPGANVATFHARQVALHATGRVGGFEDGQNPLLENLLRRWLVLRRSTHRGRFASGEGLRASRRPALQVAPGRQRQYEHDWCYAIHHRPRVLTWPGVLGRPLLPGSVEPRPPPGRGCPTTKTLLVFQGTPRLGSREGLARSSGTEAVGPPRPVTAGLGDELQPSTETQNPKSDLGVSDFGFRYDPPLDRLHQASFLRRQP